MSRDAGIIGVSDHGGWAVLVTVAGDGTLLDRRRVELVDEHLPKIPHHSEGQALPLGRDKSYLAVFSKESSNCLNFGWLADMVLAGPVNLINTLPPTLSTIAPRRR